jgi:hypothetical protein
MTVGSPLNSGRIGSRIDHTYFRRPASLWKVGRRSEGKKAIMHPMFVRLYLETDASEDERDERRRAVRSRRQRSARTLTRATVARAPGSGDQRAATRAH